MKIYIIRHGQTDWNLESRAQGRIDIPLNDTGIKQAEVLHNKIGNINFTAVYASPLKRAAKTAEIATEGKYEIIYDERLKERSFGDYEGKEISTWIDSIGCDIGDIKLNAGVGNIEPVQDVLARAKNFLDDIRTKHDNNDIILIVTHGQLACGLHHNLVGYGENTDWLSAGYYNAEVRVYDVD